MNTAQTNQFNRTPAEREENLMTDFSDFIADYVGLENLNENSCNPNLLIFNQDGQEVLVALDFKPIEEFSELDENPVERMMINIQAPLELIGLKNKIYPEGFDAFVNAMRNVYYLPDNE